MAGGAAASHTPAKSAQMCGGVVKVSSAWDANHLVASHIHFQSGRGATASAWCADSNANQWIQVAMPRPVRWVSIQTQGRGDKPYPQWVTQYQLLTSNDGINFTFVANGRHFAANSDQNTVVENHLDPPLVAQVLRIRPTAWNGHISLRFDALYEEA
eukprot:TRINITY_DN8363_c0_g1_i1.p1 TRINITY_DN8363_c0_g1~~TRINITY_DN8363_c0_g1_i1.p1  ORF type:complete len:164 (+),score=25.05 TRINITY_DN8363_c0_g1_i1:23-493(+)